MHGVTVEIFEKGELVSVQKAEEATWDTDKWIMKQGMVYELSKEEGIARTAKFEEQVMPINTRPNDVALEQKKPDQMTIKELKQQIGILKRQFLSVSKYEMEMYQRVTIPMASVKHFTTKKSRISGVKTANMSHSNSPNFRLFCPVRPDRSKASFRMPKMVCSAVLSSII